MALHLTETEKKVVYDCLSHLTAYTADELADRLEWSNAELRAYHTARSKLGAALSASAQPDDAYDPSLDMVAQEHNRRVCQNALRSPLG